MLEKNPFTYCTECPVWSTLEEINNEEGNCRFCLERTKRCEECKMEFCKRHDKCEDLLNGHIDGIDYLPTDQILLWDFKPGASKEVKASAQLWKYAWLLSLRTGISMSDMQAVYFDSQHAYKVYL